MGNLLCEWIGETKLELENIGFVVSITDSMQGATSVNLDCDEIVGTITYWPPDLFEFQFNSVMTGEVVVLETLNVSNKEQLGVYVKSFIGRIK